MYIFYLFILRASPSAAGPLPLNYYIFGYPNLPFGRPGGSILAAWGTILAPRGVILVVQGSLGTPNRAPWRPDLDFYRFLERFWVSFGSSFGLYFHIFLETVLFFRLLFCSTAFAGIRDRLFFDFGGPATP